MFSQKPTKYAFVLGHVPQLSQAEVVRVLQAENFGLKVILLTDQVLIMETNQELEVRELMARLGGTVKIAQIIDQVSGDRLIQSIKEIIVQKSKIKNQNNNVKIKNRFQFGFSLYGKADIKEFQNVGLGVKRILKEQGTPCRFVVSKEKSLSAVIIKKEHLLDQGLDLVIIANQGEYYLGGTVAIQDFEAYSTRDYGRPSRDDKSGMLPPKLAQIMINLSQVDQNDVILDPFCGSGTVLQEALMLGYKNIIGSDISAKAIADCRNNNSWLKTKYNFKIDGVKIYELDVRNLEHKVGPASVDAIITEPYLGEAQNSKLKTQSMEKLGELYINAFSQFYKVLRPGNRVVIVLPIIQGQKMEILDAIQKIGFTREPLSDNPRLSIVYGREGQRVEREIFVFKK